MKAKFIETLPDLFRENIKTLKETSSDDSDKYNIKYMTESDLNVISFDDVIKKYMKDKHFNSFIFSNDALYITENGTWIFIEFKNGKIHKDEIYRKIYDSIIMLIEKNIITSFDKVRKDFEDILVYNSENGKAQISENGTRYMEKSVL